MYLTNEQNIYNAYIVNDSWTYQIAVGILINSRRITRCVSLKVAHYLWKSAIKL